MLADRSANLFFLGCDTQAGEFEVPAHSLLGSFGALRSERELHICRYTKTHTNTHSHGMREYISNYLPNLCQVFIGWQPTCPISNAED